MTSASPAASKQPPDTLGTRIRRARLAKGLDQWDLAEAVAVAQATISNWENGRTRPSDENLARLAAALDTTVFELTPPSTSPPGSR